MTTDLEMDPFALPEDIDQEVEDQNLPPIGQRKHQNLSKKEAMLEILSYNDRRILLHNTNGTQASAKHVLDGFNIERVIEAYANGLTDEDICSFLKVKVSQLKTWLAMSQTRTQLVSRLRDIMRSQKVNDVIDASMTYEVERVYDRADEAYERLKLEAVKLRTRTAMDLDARSRSKEEAEQKQLPVVNLGFVINTADQPDEAKKSAVVVLPDGFDVKP